MKKTFIRLIRLYQKNISPKKPPCCKYYPSCSSYAIEAIEKRGAFIGFFLALFRILRCNPFAKGGYDPVPEKKQKQTSGTNSLQASARPDAITAYIARHSSARPSSAGFPERIGTDISGADENDNNRI